MKKYQVMITFLVISFFILSCGKNESSKHPVDPDDEIETSLKEFENRKKYTSFTAEILRNIPDDKIEIAVIDYITDRKIAGNFEEENRIVKSLGRGFRNIYITSEFESEVNNGGFIQYFYNTSGEFNSILPAALHDIGAYSTEKITRDAIALYAKERKLHEGVKREGTMESFMNSYGESGLEKSDELFFKSGEDLSGLRIQFIRKHPELFIAE